MDWAGFIVLAALSVDALALCEAHESATVTPSGHLDNTVIEDDQLDLMAFEAIRDHRLSTAMAAFGEILTRDDEDAFAAMWLGMIAVGRSDLKLAEVFFAHAVSAVDKRMCVEDDSEAFALAAKRAQLELSLQRVRQRMEPAAGTAAARPLLRRTSIRRVHYTEMGQAHFEEAHAEARRPVIIEGFPPLASPPWSIEELRRTCGRLRPPLVHYSATSASWAGMFKDGPPPSSLEAFLDAITAKGHKGGSGGDSGGSSGGGSHSDGHGGTHDDSHAEEVAAGGEAVLGRGMVFDWALRQKGEGAGCAALLETLHIPSYFGNTILSGYGPSLFIQPNGTRCGLHYDKGGTHFWQYVWAGAKRWRIFAPSDWPRLFEEDAWRRAFFRDPRCSGLFGAAAEAAAGCDDGFGALLVDAFDDAGLESLAAQSGGAPLEVFEATLHPGELLFVPAGAPHQVVNVGGAGVAMSMNYADFTNAQEAFHTLLENAKLHPRVRSRLNKSGTVVPGSRTRWYERFRMPLEGDEERRMSAAAQHVRQQSARPDAAFLESWDTFAKRPWNLHLVQG